MSEQQSEIQRGGEFNALSEEVRHFPTYADASIYGCRFVDAGKKKINPSELKLYNSRLKASPAYGMVVGVGLQTPAGSIVPYIRLDMDNTGKGIHFNATELSDSDKNLAAVLEKTIHMDKDTKLDIARRTDLYMQYIKALEHRSAEFIWHWWRTGVAG